MPGQVAHVEVSLRAPGTLVILHTAVRAHVPGVVGPRHEPHAAQLAPVHRTVGVPLPHVPRQPALRLDLQAAQSAAPHHTRLRVLPTHESFVRCIVHRFLGIAGSHCTAAVLLLLWTVRFCGGRVPAVSRVVAQSGDVPWRRWVLATEGCSIACPDRNSS